MGTGRGLVLAAIPFTLVLGACTSARCAPWAPRQSEALAEGVAVATEVQMAISARYDDTGQLAGSNAELRLPPPEAYSTDAVKSVAVGKRGIVTIAFTAISGLDGGSVTFAPRNQSPLGWDCATENYPLLPKYFDACRYDGPRACYATGRAPESAARSEAPAARACIRQGLRPSAEFKTAITAFIQNEGRFPVSNSDAGLSPGATYASEALEAAEVTRNGVVELRYKHCDGVDGGVVRLVPDASRRQVGVQWSCSTSSFPGIDSVAPGCTYDGSAN